MMELERLQVVIEANTKPLQQELGKVSGSVNRMENTVSKATEKMKASFAKVTVAAAAIGFAAKKAIDSIGGMARDAQSMEAQANNLSRLLGDNAQAYLNWAKHGATAFGISEKAAVEYGNTFSTIISSFTSDTGQMAGLTQQMLETSAIVASKTGRTMDDVLTKIRSGLWGNTQAIDDLGINVKQSALVMTDAYKQIAGNQSWNQLSFNQQQAILYFGILEQAGAAYGNTIDPVLQKQLILSAQLANLKTNLGNAFLPVVNIIIPILQHLVGWLNVAATYIRAFFELLFGAQGSINKTTKASNELGIAMGNMGNGIVKSSENTASNMKDSENSAAGVGSGMNKAAKAAQKIKNMLAGFDELNILSEPSANAGDSIGGGPIGGGGGISFPSTPDWGMDGLETSANSFKSAFENVNKTIQEAKQNISDFIGRIKDGFKDLLPVIAGIAAGFGLMKLVDLITNGDGVVNVLDDILKKLPLIGNHPAIASLSGALSTVLAPIDKILFGLSSIATKIGTALGFTGTSAAVAGFAVIGAVIAAVVAALVEFYNKSEEFREKVSTAIEGVGEIFSNIWNTILKPIFDVFMATLNLVWEQGIKPLWDSFVNFIGAIATLLLNIWNSVLQPLVNFIIDVIGPVIAVVIGGIIILVGGFFTAVSNIVGWILDLLSGLINWVAGFFEGTWKDVLNRIGGFFVGLWEGVKQAFNWIVEAGGKAVEGIKQFFAGLGSWFDKNVIQPVAKFFSGLWESIKNFASNAWIGIQGIWNGVKTWFNNTVIIPVNNFFSGLWDGVKNFAANAWTGIKNTFNGVKTWFSTNVTEPIKNVFSNAWNSVKTTATNIWNGILGIFSKGGKIFDGIKDGIAGVFKTIVNSLIGGINKVIATPFNIVNGLLNKIKDISILGMKPFNGFWGYNPLPVPQIPKLATGTNYIQREGLAYLHEGEAVVPKKYNPAAGGGGVEQIVLLQEQNSLLRQLLEKDSGVYLDGKEITDKTVKNIKQRERLTGKPVFGV